MIEVPSQVNNESNVLTTQKYTGLHLEPPTRDVVSFFFWFKLQFIEGRNTHTVTYANRMRERGNINTLSIN